MGSGLPRQPGHRGEARVTCVRLYSNGYDGPLRACSTSSARSCCVEQALSLCVKGQLYRRADALIADAALRACSTSSARSCCVEQALSLCVKGQLYRRADALIAVAALRACSTSSARSCCVEQALSLCVKGQLYRRADALIAVAALSPLRSNSRNRIGAVAGSGRQPSDHQGREAEARQHAALLGRAGQADPLGHGMRQWDPQRQVIAE